MLEEFYEPTLESLQETEGLLETYEDDAATINDYVGETSPEGENTSVVGSCGMLRHCDCGSLSCRARDLQLPSSSKTIHESWTIIYRQPRKESQSWFRCLGGMKLWTTTNYEPGEVVATVPQNHFDQAELSATVDRARKQYEPLTFVSCDYEGDLERRLRRLDVPVQEELYSLIRDRTENASNSFRRREYKLVVLARVPGGEMTDASSSSWVSRSLGCVTARKGRDRRASSHVEYRVILRGSEVKANDAGWGVYSRYSQPWKLADEADLANRNEKGDGYKTLLE